MFFQGKTRRLPLALLGLLAAGLLTTACKKDDTITAAPDYKAADDATITKYLADKLLTGAQKQKSGLYYVPLVTNANAAKPDSGNTVSVLYTGMLLNGTIFDATAQSNNVPYNFALKSGTLISGFDEGVSLMHLGDSAVFILPSGLAYGPNIVGKIPANSILRFNVKLVDINFTVTDDKLIRDYLKLNSITTARKLPSGLYFVPGITNASAALAAKKTASVLYTGKLLDGTIFDASSQNNNVPLQFLVGEKPPKTIPGFDEGIALMHKGDKATLLIPSKLAYGLRGAGTAIKPNSVLRFDVEVTDVK